MTVASLESRGRFRSSADVEAAVETVSRHAREVGGPSEPDALVEPRDHRAIGVVYRPANESGNYVPTVMPDRYDAVVHIDETEALHPIALHPDRERVPELYPSGF